MYRGFGDSLSRSFELALTPPIIAAFGYLLDRLLGIVPVLTIVFFLTAMIGLIATMWYGYDARMKVHEQDGPWAKQSQDQAPMNQNPTSLLTADHGPAVEPQVAIDMARRVLPAVPVIVLVAGLIWGLDGAASAAFAVLLVLANLAASAYLLATAARISLPLLMVAALGGFVVRLALLTGIVLAGQGPGLGRHRRPLPHPGRHPPRPAHLGDPPHIRLPGLPRAQADRRQAAGTAAG